MLYPFECYGIKELSVEEEINLPENAKRTRVNKMKGIDLCLHTKELLDIIEDRLRTAPERDDKLHADLVQKLVDKVNDICNETFYANGIGRM